MEGQLSPARVAVIGTVGTLLGVAATLIGARISNYQLQTAQQQLIITDRPWIKIESIDEKTLRVDEYGASFGMKVNLKNVGHSPATGIRIKSKAYFMTNSNVKDQIANTCESADNSVGLPGVLFPDDDNGDDIRRYVNASGNFIKPLIDNSNETFENAKDLRDDFNMRFLSRTKRFQPLITAVVCVSYDVYRDIRKHYTASYLIIFKKRPEGVKYPIPREQAMANDFDLQEKKLYRDNDLEVMQSNGKISLAD